MRLDTLLREVVDSVYTLLINLGSLSFVWYHTWVTPSSSSCCCGFVPHLFSRRCHPLPVCTSMFRCSVVRDSMNAFRCLVHTYFCSTRFDTMCSVLLAQRDVSAGVTTQEVEYPSIFDARKVYPSCTELPAVTRYVLHLVAHASLFRAVCKQRAEHLLDQIGRGKSPGSHRPPLFPLYFGNTGCLCACKLRLYNSTCILHDAHTPEQNYACCLQM